MIDETSKAEGSPVQTVREGDWSASPGVSLGRSAHDAAILAAISRGLKSAYAVRLEASIPEDLAELARRLDEFGG